MATWVDKMLACDPQHLTVTRVRRIIEETILHYDPDRAAADEQAALAARHVTLVHDSGPATTEVHMRLDTLDALHLDDTLADLATGLRRLGDTDSLEVRRAKAVGVLADPQRALDLLETGVLGEPTSRGGRVELFVHLASADLADPTRAGRGDRAARVRPPGTCSRPGSGRPDLAGITVRPVLDLHRPDTVDRHDPPAWMRHAAVQADATCVFPGCTRDSRGCDLDHITAYRPIEDGGPPGQTRLANLGTAVPHPPPAQDPRRLDLPAPRRQPLPVDHPDRRPPRGPHPPPHPPPHDADDPDRPTPASTPSRRAEGMPSPGPGACGRLICVVSTSSTTEVAASTGAGSVELGEGQHVPSGSVNQATRSPFGVVHTPWASCSTPS